MIMKALCLANTPLKYFLFKEIEENIVYFSLIYHWGIFWMLSLHIAIRHMLILNFLM